MRFIRLVMWTMAVGGAMCSMPQRAQAQTPDTPTSQVSIAPSLSDAKQQISASPFLVMWKYFNVEYERRATKANTGVSTSFVPGRDADYRNVGAFWHYYPAGRALHGFYLGGRVQVHHGSALTESATLGGVGFELGKNWIIGRRTLVGLGVGATRLFGGPLAGDSLTLPTFRIANLGITF
jgi:hypothetical protein